MMKCTQTTICMYFPDHHVHLTTPNLRMSKIPLKQIKGGVEKPKHQHQLIVLIHTGWVKNATTLAATVNPQNQHPQQPHQYSHPQLLITRGSLLPPPSAVYTTGSQYLIYLSVVLVLHLGSQSQKQQYRVLMIRLLDKDLA